MAYVPKPEHLLAKLFNELFCSLVSVRNLFQGNLPILVNCEIWLVIYTFFQFVGSEEFRKLYTPTDRLSIVFSAFFQQEGVLP